MRLGPQIDWQHEKECLQGIAKEIAFACVPVVSDPDDANEADGIKWIIEHVWFANMLGKRGAYVPSKAAQSKAIFQVAAMSDLCELVDSRPSELSFADCSSSHADRVFERC